VGMSAVATVQNALATQIGGLYDKIGIPVAHWGRKVGDFVIGSVASFLIAGIGGIALGGPVRNKLLLGGLVKTTANLVRAIVPASVQPYLGDHASGAAGGLQGVGDWVTSRRLGDYVTRNYLGGPVGV